MKAKDLRERSAEDLKELEKSLRKDLFQHRFKNFTNRLDNTSLVRKTRKDLARVLTLIGQTAKGTTPVSAEKAPAPKKAPKKESAAPKAQVAQVAQVAKAASANGEPAKEDTAAKAEKSAKKTPKKKVEAK